MQGPTSTSTCYSVFLTKLNYPASSSSSLPQLLQNFFPPVFLLSFSHSPFRLGTRIITELNPPEFPFNSPKKTVTNISSFYLCRSFNLFCHRRQMQFTDIQVGVLPRCQNALRSNFEIPYAFSYVVQYRFHLLKPINLVVLVQETIIMKNKYLGRKLFLYILLEMVVSPPHSHLRTTRIKKLQSARLSFSFPA